MFGQFASISDFIDILFVAVLLYTAMVWVRTTRAAFVLRGILVLAVVYIIARQFDLQLTAWIFQGFFAIFLIMIVVIFQEELRQMFERVAVWSWKSSATPPLQSETTQLLVRAVADLAKERIGALIVVAGGDPLGRHIVGGIPLDGKLSEPLVRSIFDPHSPGHDGAVIIERDRATRFAAHLPLSKDMQQLAGVGTRHSAALGLAELTDALAIVVSEQRGTIAVAKDGRLYRLGNPQELVGLLERFLQKETAPERRWKWVPAEHFRENWQGKALAFALAAGFWYVLVPGSKVMEATYRIPVQVQNLPADYELESFQPTEVEATFSGPRRAFYLIRPKRLKAAVNASAVQSGRRTFTISAQNILHPNEIKVEDVKPSTLLINVRHPAAGDGVRGG